jgi:hypothetical protein
VSYGPELEALLAPVLMCLRLQAKQGLREAPAGAHGWRYRSFAELVLDAGRVFDRPAAAGVDPVPPVWRGPERACFLNASAWSTEAGLPYVEGWAATALMVVGVEHAWCLDANGGVLDPTWPAALGTVYLGVAVSAEYRRQVRAPGLFAAHPPGMALLRDGLPDWGRVEGGRPIPGTPE